jgi:hypothetical protein
MTTSHLSSIISRDYPTERSYRVVSDLSCYVLILGASTPGRGSIAESLGCWSVSSSMLCS